MPNKDYQFTQRARAALDRELAMYSQEEAKKIIQALLSAEEDRRGFLLNRLAEIFAFHTADHAHSWEERRQEILAQEDQLLDRKDRKTKKQILERIPVKETLRRQLAEQLLNRLADTFYTLYKSCPRTSDHMKRVLHVHAPEYDHLPARTALLKKFVQGAGFSCKTLPIDAVAQWVISRFDASKARQYQGANEEKKLSMLVNSIEDDIFALLPQVQEDLSDLEKLSVMTACLQKLLDNPETYTTNGCPVQDAVFSMETDSRLNSFLRDHGIDPGGSRRMDLLLALLKAEHPLGDLYPALEKDFKTQLRTVFYLAKSGKRKNSVEMFEDRLDYVREAKRAPLALLPLCDDLAAGRFQNSNSATRERLYQTAIVLGMDEAQVEKFFVDYYNDDLLRYLEPAYADPKTAAAFEKEPSGISINYKNYMECAYLYYLLKPNLTLTAGERIDAAAKIPDRRKALIKKLKIRDSVQPRSDLTQKRRDEFHDVILQLSEKELVPYLVQNFQTRTTAAGVSLFAIAPRGAAAYKLIAENLDMIENAAVSTMDMMVEAKIKTERRQELSDIIRDQAIQVQEYWLLPKKLRTRYPHDADFLRVVDQLNSRLTSDLFFLAPRQGRIAGHVLAELQKHGPMKKRRLKDILTDAKVTSSELDITRACRLLKEAGCPIYADGAEEAGEDEKKLSLPAPADMPLELAELLKVMEQKGVDHIAGKLHQLFLKQFAAKASPARSALLSTCLLRSILCADDYATHEDIPDNAPLIRIDLNDQTFSAQVDYSGLHQFFTAPLNRQLQEAGFAPFNEKYLLDLYVLLSLCFYKLAEVDLLDY